MSFNLDKIKARYQTQVQNITSELGVVITLTYVKPTFTTTTNNSLTPYGMNDFNINGAPSQLSDLPGRFEADNTSSVKPDTYTETITARFYWEEDVKKINHLFNNTIQLDDKVGRIVCNKQDAVKIQQASFISISKDGQIVNMKAIITKAPILYGLGESTSSAIVYCVTA